MGGKIMMASAGTRYLAISLSRLRKPAHEGRATCPGFQIEPGQPQEISGIDAWQIDPRGFLLWPF